LENVSELKETHTKKLENCELFFLLPAIVLRQEKTQKKVVGELARYVNKTHI